MQSRRGEEWRHATQIVGRRAGLWGKPKVAPWTLIAALFLASAALLALSPSDSVGTYLGAALWLIAAFMAIRGWIRLDRVRRGKPT
jgi:hypothetical protein